MKTLKTLALAALATFVFTACGGNKSGEGSDADTTTTTLPADIELMDEADNAVDNVEQMMEEAVDSTGAALDSAEQNMEEAIEEATTSEEK